MTHNPSYVYFTVPDGKTAGMAGVGKEVIYGCFALLIYTDTSTFAREAKRYVDSRNEPLLWNIVDSRNKVHLKLLRFLGFKFLRKFEHGPNSNTIYRILPCAWMLMRVLEEQPVKDGCRRMLSIVLNP